MLSFSTSSDSFRLPSAFWFCKQDRTTRSITSLGRVWSLLEERGTAGEVLTSRVVCCGMDEVTDSFEVGSLWTGVLWRRKGMGTMTRRCLPQRLRKGACSPNGVCGGAPFLLSFPMALSGNLREMAFCGEFVVGDPRECETSVAVVPCCGRDTCPRHCCVHLMPSIAPSHPLLHIPAFLSISPQTRFLLFLSLRDAHTSIRRLPSSHPSLTRTTQTRHFPITFKSIHATLSRILSRFYFCQPTFLLFYYGAFLSHIPLPLSSFPPL